MRGGKVEETVGSYKVIATKVSPEAAEMLEALAKRHGMSVYNLLQMMCRVFVTMMCEEAPVSEELAKIIRLFEGMSKSKERFSIMDRTATPKVDAAVYLLGANGKTGNEAVMVDKRADGELVQTYNLQAILEAFLCKALPSFYRRLRALGVEMECGSIYETIDKIIDLQLVDPNEQEVHRMFKDNERCEWGGKRAEAPYVRHNNRDIDKL